MLSLMYFENIYFDISDIYKTLQDLLWHFFCMKFTSVNKKNKHHVVPSDILPVRKYGLHGTEVAVPSVLTEVPVPSVPKDIDIAEDSDTELEDMGTSASYQVPIPDQNKPTSLS